MPYCENCGAQISDTAKFCTECGAPCRVRPKQEMPPVEPSVPEVVPVMTQPQPVVPQPQPVIQQPAAPQPQPVVPQPQPVAVVQPVEEPSPVQPAAAPVEQTFFAPPATAAAAAAAPVAAVVPETQSKPRKGMAALAYLGILVLIPLLFARKDPFAKAHTAQGLTLYLMTLVCNTLSELLMGKLTAINPVLTIAVYTVLGALSAVLFVFSVVGLIWALGGKNKTLPLVGKIKLLK